MTLSKSTARMAMWSTAWSFDVKNDFYILISVYRKNVQR